MRSPAMMTLFEYIQGNSESHDDHNDSENYIVYSHTLSSDKIVEPSCSASFRNYEPFAVTNTHQYAEDSQQYTYNSN